MNRNSTAEGERIFAAALQMGARPLDEFFTVQDVAAILKLRRVTVLAHIRRGNLHGIKVVPGGPWLIHVSEIQRFKRERRKPGRPKTKITR